MLRQVISRLRNASRKVNNRTVARAAFRRKLFVESLENRRVLSVTGNAGPSILVDPYSSSFASAIPGVVSGATVTVWNDLQSSSATASQFDNFDFIYLGDTASSSTGVVASKNAWGQAISGRAAITGVHFEHASSSSPSSGPSRVLRDMSNWIHAGCGTGLLVSSQYQSSGPDWIPNIAPFNGITYAQNGSGFDNVRIVDPGHATMATA